MISLRLTTAAAIGSLMLGAALAPAAAFAESAVRNTSTVVHFADINLKTRAGVAVLYRRIHSAARAVCGPAERPGSRIPVADAQTCIAGVVRTAVERLDQPLLATYYAERVGRKANRRWQYSTASE